MVGKRTLWISAPVAAVAIGGIAIGADRISERDEVSEQKIALSDVPPAAMQGAQTQLASIKKAELVKLKGGRTLYEIKGKNQAGKTVELYVGADGQIAGIED